MICITGATSGIGEACAEQFASRGHSLFLLGRNSQKLSQAKKSLTEKYRINVETSEVDLCQTKSIQDCFNKNEHLFRKVTCLINNAGLARGLGPTYHLSIEDIEVMIQTNLTALILISKLMIPFFLQNKAGHIINIGSVAGHHVYPNGNVYCATKSAVRAMTQGLRMDLHGTGIRISEISPGMVNTNFSTTRLGDKNKADQVYAGMTPLSAFDIAEAVTWIFERPAHINIEDIIIYPTDQASPTLVNRKN